MGGAQLGGAQGLFLSSQTALPRKIITGNMILKAVLKED